ncbi:MAG TPA: AMP-binding protein [Rhizomicrobium sp.]|nr:AMP-binding protein [Rhizomicrobium sp.]
MLPALTSRAELEAEQLKRLKWSIAHAYNNVPHYRAKCEAAGVTPDDVRSHADLARFPFTLKSDFRKTYPFGMFAAPREECVRLHASSGTSGTPTVVGYTRADIDLWKTLIARCILVAGGKQGDMLHNAYGYGLFTGGLGLHGGAEKLGCTVVPASGGQTERQVQLIRDLKPRIICATPSYMLALAEALERAGIDPRQTSLEIGIHGAEPWSEEMRGEIERRFGIAALDIYGLSEVLGPGVAQERADARGALTVWEDAFYPEIIDPEAGTPLPDGEEGELAFTSLSKEAVPLIRYRTGDLSRLTAPVGDIPMRRMDRILGRSDDMLIVRGVNIFPRQIEELIISEPSLTAHYRIDVRRDGSMDKLFVTCEASTDDATLHNRARAEVSRHMKSKYGLTAEIVIAAPGSLPRSEGKAKRVFDHRREKP